MDKVFEKTFVDESVYKARIDAEKRKQEESECTRNYNLLFSTYFPRAFATGRKCTILTLNYDTPHDTMSSDGMKCALDRLVKEDPRVTFVCRKTGYEGEQLCTVCFKK
jgi:hypothetical protein